MAKVRFLVRDLDRAVATYQRAFGCELIEQHGQAFALLRLGDLDLGLSGPESSAYLPLDDGTVAEPGGWNRILVETDDLDAAAERFVALGLRLRNGIVRGRGGAQILVEDGEGNVVEVFQTEPIEDENG